MAFEADVFLLTKAAAKALRAGPDTPPPPPQPGPSPTPGPEPRPAPLPGPAPRRSTGAADTTLRLAGTVPPEVWNRMGTRLLPKLRSGKDLSVGIELSVTVDAQAAPDLEAELKLALQDLGLSGRVRIDDS